MLVKLLRLIRKIGILKWFLKQENKLGIHHYLLNADEVESLFMESEPSDVIVCRAGFELTTLQQDLVGECDFTHAVFLHNKGLMSDMTDGGLRKRSIWNTFQGCNRMALLRLVDITKEQQFDLCVVAEKVIEEGAIYDYDFTINNNVKKVEEKEDSTVIKKMALYCSEYVYKVYSTVFPDKLALREQLGELVITPTDLYKNKHFRVVRELRVKH